MAVGVGSVSAVQNKAVAIENGLPELTKAFRVAGICPSSTPTAKVPVISSFITPVAAEVAPAGSFPVGKLTANWLSITIPKVGIDAVAPWEDLTGDQQRLMDEAYLQYSIQQALLKFNVDLATLIFTSSTWTGSVITPDFGDADHNVPGTLRGWLETISSKIGGMYPNVLWMGAALFAKIIEHASLRERVNPTMPQAVQEDLLASILGMAPGSVVVTRAATNTGPVVPNAVAFAGYVSQAGTAIAIEPSAILTPRWTAAGGSDNQPWRFRREYVFKGTDNGVAANGTGTGDDVWIYRTETFMKPYATLLAAGGKLTDTVAP